MSFREGKIEELQFNPFTKIGKEWLLITAGDEEKHNTMTASWGGVGVLWGKMLSQLTFARSATQKSSWMHKMCLQLHFLGKTAEKRLHFVEKCLDVTGIKSKKLD